MGKVIWGIIWIIAGLSGQFVLIGTNSSAALVVGGIGLVIWDIAQMGTTEETATQVEPEKDTPKHINP